MFTQQRSLPCLRLVLVVLLALGYATVTRAKVVPAQHTLESADNESNIILQIYLDKFIDKNIKVIQETILPLDPLKLKDVDYPVTSKIHINFYNGWMQNLSLIKRVGTCSVSYTNKVLIANMQLGWDNIAVDFQYFLKMFMVKRKGDLHILMSKLKLNIDLDIDFNTYQIILKRLEFMDKGKITASLEGHIVDKIYNIIIKVVMNFLKDKLFEAIESKATKMIELEIDELNHFIEGHHNKQFTFLNLAEINHRSNFLF